MKTKFIYFMIILSSSYALLASEQSHIDFAKEYMRDSFVAIGIDKYIENSIERETNRVVSNLSLAHPCIENKKTELYNIVKKYMEKRISREKLISIMANVITEIFTQEELEELLAFNKKPLGQKVLMNYQKMQARMLLEIQSETHEDKEAEDELKKNMFKLLEDSKECQKERKEA